jgi:hypothetical protein
MILELLVDVMEVDGSQIIGDIQKQDYSTSELRTSLSRAGRLDSTEETYKLLLVTYFERPYYGLLNSVSYKTSRLWSVS